MSSTIKVTNMKWRWQCLLRGILDPISYICYEHLKVIGNNKYLCRVPISVWKSSSFDVWQLFISSLLVFCCPCWDFVAQCRCVAIFAREKQTRRWSTWPHFLLFKARLSWAENVLRMYGVHCSYLFRILHIFFIWTGKIDNSNKYILLQVAKNYFSD